ncbi:hypothetical protein ACWGJ2_32990 [Streptomyces sp. NPDC054796]
MASRIASVCFTARIDGFWHEAGDYGHHDPEVQARDYLRRQAAQITRHHCVLDPAGAQDAVNTALMQWNHPAPGLSVTGRIRLKVSDQDRGLAQEHARRQRAADLEQEEELHRLQHLQQILADPSLRRVWWMDRFPDRPDGLNTLKQELADLPEPQRRVDDDLRSDIRRFTDQLVTTMHTPQQREIFLTALVQALRALGHHDLQTSADRWRTRQDPGSTPA